LTSISSTETMGAAAAGCGRTVHPPIANHHRRFNLKCRFLLSESLSPER
jgi:hypothetical protein